MSWRGAWLRVQITGLVFSSMVWLVVAGLSLTAAATVLAVGVVWLLGRNTRAGLWWRFGARPATPFERDQVLAIFAMQGDELATPSLDQGVLSGITRRILLEHAKELGLKPVERVVPLEDLVRADAVFLCNSLRFIRPVTTLNGEPLGKGSLDRLIEELGGLAKKQCGTDPRTLM